MFRRPVRGRLVRAKNESRESADHIVSQAPVATLPCQAEGGSPTGQQTQTRQTDEGLLDARLAPIPQPRVVPCRSATLPKFLRVAGNFKAWGSLLNTLKEAPHKAVLLYGPTGCGKSRGVCDIATRCLGMTIAEFNAASVSTTNELTRKLKAVTGSRTLLGQRVALVEDIDGFEPSYIAVLGKLLQSRTEDDGPLVITCTNPFDRSLMCLRSIALVQIRLYSPNLSQMIEAARDIRSDLTPSVITHHAERANGNFHQLFIRLRTYINSSPDAHVGLFETTQSLLKCTSDVETWMRSADATILTTILQENFLEICSQRVDEDWVDFAELLSGTRPLTAEVALTITGMGAKRFLHTNAPPPLRLPKRPNNAVLPLHECDMPTLLRTL